MNSREHESAAAMSDASIKEFMSSQGLGEGDIKHAVTILAECHKISIRTVHQGKLEKNIKRAEAFMASEPSVIHRLKLRFQQPLHGKDDEDLGPDFFLQSKIEKI